MGDIGELSAEYWNNRYLNGEAGWDLGAIAPPLKEYFDGLHNKNISILIPGAGNAHEAQYLCEHGFKNVWVCDIADEPLKNLLARVKDFDSKHALKIDFFELRQKFDLVIEQTFFCALNPALRQAYFDKMAQILHPGGRLVGLLFDDALNSDHPPFGGSKAEYLTYIKAPFSIRTFDACYNSVKPRAGRELFVNLELGR